MTLAPAQLDLAEPWAIHADYALRAISQLPQVALGMSNERAAVEIARTLFPNVAFGSTPRQLSALPVADGAVAVIPVRGVLTKSGSWFDGSGSLTQIRSLVNAAAADPNVAAIMLSIDSPGGTVAGIADAAAAINAAKAVKPVWAYVEDLAASGAMWLATQADRIFANQPSAAVGSIGTYAVIHDLSAMAAKEGIKVHVIRAGEHKGAGEPGTEVTAAQLAEWQSRINATNELFLAAVSSGRKMSLDAVRAIATGKVWLASEAKSLGLVDGIKNFGDVVGELVATAKPSKKRPAAQGARMSDQDKVEGPKAATIQELKAACPGAPSDWVLGQLEAGATVAQAQAAYIRVQQEQLESAKKAAEKAAAEAAERVKASAPLQGYAGVRRSSSEREPETKQAGETGDPKADFDAAVREKIKDHGMTRREAVQAVSRQNPKLHEAFLLATNDPGVAGKIKARFAEV